MKKLLVFAIILTLPGLSLHAQEEETEQKKNAIYMEIFGDGVVVP